MSSEELPISPEEMIAPEDIETEEDVLRKLHAVEELLAQRELLVNRSPDKGGSIRQQLITLIRHQVLPEDELVARWLDLYTTHTYWERRKARARNLSVSVYDAGNGELQVWGVSFTVKGHLNKKDGKVDEADRAKKAKMIQKALANLDFSNLE